jgi:hypothetical protein
MKPSTPWLPLILAGGVLLIGAMLLATNRLEYCGQPAALRPSIGVVAAAPTHTPTLAPPQKAIFVRIESDEPNLEVGWAEN